LLRIAGERLRPVFNSFAIRSSSRSIPVVKVVSTAESYSRYVKPFLLDPRNMVAHVARMTSGGIYESYVAGVEVGLDGVNKCLEGLRGYGEIEGPSSVDLERAARLVERALFKKLSASGWSCEHRYGYYRCYKEGMRLGASEVASTSAPWLFTFYRRYVYKVLPIEGELYLFVEPRLLVRGADFRSLLEHVGMQKLGEALREGVACNAYRESEKRYRSAIAIGLKDAAEGLQVEVVYFDGVSSLVKPEKVRLKGSVLYLKRFIEKVFDQRTYEVYSRLQRQHSFSLGPRESEFAMGSKFKEEAEKFIKEAKDDGVLPLTLSGVSVDVGDRVLEVGRDEVR